MAVEEKDLAVIPQEAPDVEEPEVTEDEDINTGEEDEEDDAGDGPESDDEAEPEGEEPEEPEAPEAQRKEIQERLLERDRELEDTRANLKDDWDDLTADSHEFSDPILLNGKAAYLVSDKEFDAITDSIEAEGDADRLKLLRKAKAERRAYLRVKPRLEKVHRERTKVMMEDIAQIKQAYIEISPEYEKHFDDVDRILADKFEESPARLERFIWGGIRDKFRLIDRVIDESGIKAKVEKEIGKKEKPGLSVVTGTGKGKRGTPAAKSAKPVFTRAQIAKMSDAEYEHREKEIDKAMLEGRIR